MVGRILAVAVLLPTPVLAQGTGAEAVRIAAVRFFRPSSGSTTFEVLGDVRLSAVAPPSGGPTVRYRVEAAVLDSTRMALASSGWDRAVAFDVAQASGATAAETFTFAAGPGQYTVRLRAVAAGGDTVDREVAIRAFEGRPAVSDLLLATGVRQAVADSAAPGEVVRQGLAMRTAPVPQLALDSAQVAYYLEVYPWQGAAVDGQLRVEVTGAGDRRFVATPPRSVRFEAAGGVARGSLDLTGLPVGSYVLRVLVTLGDSTVSAAAAFAVATRRVAVVAAPTAPPGDVFDAMSEARLDSLYGPLEYVLEDSERRVFHALSGAGKRRFFREVWRRRDPTPATPDNPALDDFLRVVDYTNQAFRESGQGVQQGWATDRGRIYLRNGRPDEVLRRPAASPRPYEVWKFTRGRQRYYVFWDQSGFGFYRLLASNDTRESTLFNWESYLGTEGTQDVMQFIR